MRTWFITGASRGLGLAIAKAALGAGENVVATGRNPEAIIQGLGCAGDRMLPLALDVTDPKQIDNAVTVAAERFGSIDILVNNAGYGLLGPFEELSRAAVAAQFATNVFGAFDVTRAILPIMRRQRRGQVFTISSIAGVRGYEGASVYCASKAAVAAWSESLSAELGRFGILATVIHPGYFRTDFLDQSSVRYGDVPIADYTDFSLESHEARRVRNHQQEGDPEAFGRALLELAGVDALPMRFAAGTDAVKIIEERAASLLETSSAWRLLSTSTDFVRAE